MGAFCSWPGCRLTVKSGTRCEEHQRAAEARRIEYQAILSARPQAREARRAYNANRPFYHAWYHSPRWREARRLFLAAHPICCTPGCGAIANVVDHVQEHDGDEVLFWDRNNWQSMCRHCHVVKHTRTTGERRPQAHVESYPPRL